MKKTLVILLILAIAGGSAFGQISTTVKFGVTNVAGANDEKADPWLGLVFAAAGEQELGPGKIHFGLQTPIKIRFQDESGSSYADGLAVFDVTAFDADDFFVGLGYGMELGPGTLDVTLQVWPLSGIYDAGIVGYKPIVGYSGLEVGPVTLGFDVWYGLNVSGINSDGKRSMFGKELLGDDGTDTFGFDVSAEFDFGLTVDYGFAYGIGAKEVMQIAYVNVGYEILKEQLYANVELDNTADGEGNFFEGFTIKPSAKYVINDNMSAGLWVGLNNINGEGDITIEPGIWFKYTL
ncbi:MAG: hypothetical protein FWG27_02175 [Treponema sp.]|nr:hypothetical protein [Treponema sp.]